MTELPGDGPLAAGEFESWLADTRDALAHGGAADVPCDGCTACCTSAQFVHVEPDETATLARIPVALQFPAPGRPRGHVVIGYDGQGRCPMLVDGGCSIYDDRTRACRTYDCRVFAATGLEPDGPGQVDLVARVRRWQFSYGDEQGQRSHDELLARARALQDDMPSSTGATEVALRSIGARATDDVDQATGSDCTPKRSW
jgi:Fe-S-cluster containining protein